MSDTDPAETAETDADETPAVIAPGGTIGIFGGGQLGRMTALAAAELGYRVHIYCPEADCPAAQVAAAATTASYDDAGALDAFAEAVDVVTFEFENIPHDSVQRVAATRPVRPGWRALHVSQDRLREKNFLREIGVSTVDYQPVTDEDELASALARIGRPALLKTRRLGYDGKGQAVVRTEADVGDAVAVLGDQPGIVEAFVEYEREISVIAARGIDGAGHTYVPVENQHTNGILDQTLAPARISPDLVMRAEATARHIAEHLDIVGLLAVEMFVMPSGGSRGPGPLLVNELAPRPHNSGHWTIDACATSQFEQFVRAVTGLPLGTTERHSDAVMKNLIGDDVKDWAALAAEPGARLHLYGKAEARPGRKMGHVTRISPREES